MKKFNPNPDGTPEELLTFIRNNPNMRHKNLYLCQVVDEDNNVLDTKIGVNLVTNYCLTDHFVNGTRRLYSGAGGNLSSIWLGGGQSPIDPTSSQLEDYYSNLGSQTGRTILNTYDPFEYDDTTGLWTVTWGVMQQYWDYTEGSNAEYEIWELGIGYTRTTLWTHAHVYDEHGQQTCIVKRPNTRLYVSVYLVGYLRVSDITQMYNDGKYLLIDPKPSLLEFNYNLYWNLRCRTTAYRPDRRTFNDNTGYPSNTWGSVYYNMRAAATADPSIVTYNKGVNASDVYYFWQNTCYFMTGWYIGTASIPISDMWGTGESQKHPEIACFVRYQMDTPEELETYWALPNKGFIKMLNGAKSSYAGDECDDKDFVRLDEMFGATNSRPYYSSSNLHEWANPDGFLPCVQFDISELKQYNYISKEWDINVPHINAPNRNYDNEFWKYVYKSIKVRLDGTIKTVYVFVNASLPQDANGNPVPRIVAFNNSGIVISATDTYWDPSTYEAIANLNDVPVSLQRKRYYIITSGSNAVLSPVYASEDDVRHEYSRKPIELSHDTTGVLDRIPYYKATTDWGKVAPYASSGAYDVRDGNYSMGGQPIFNNEKGYFVIAWRLIFADASWNVTEYDLLINSGTVDEIPPDKMRRWNTRTGDKIVMFRPRTYRKITSGVPATSDTNGSYANAANTFAVWTIADSNTAPTKQEFNLADVWSDSSLVNNNTCWHRYSWSDLGYLVVAKRRTETEFAWINVNEAEPTLHLVTNAQHAYVIERTNKVCYFDTNLSDGTTFLFPIYDMENDTIVDTITIDDGVAYTVKGIYAFNENVYIRLVTPDNVNMTYYYDYSEGTGFMTNDKYYIFMDSIFPYWCYRTTPLEEDVSLISYSINTTSNWRTEMLKKGTADPTEIFGGDVSTYCNARQFYPCVNKINGGKQYIFCSSGYATSGSGEWAGDVIVFDIGLYLDGFTEYHDRQPSAQNQVGDTNGYYHQLFPYNDGIIVTCGTNITTGNDYKCGRIWWFPIELCMPSYMKGTTTTLNSFNNPIRWTCDQQFQFNITNDLSNILPQNGG